MLDGYHLGQLWCGTLAAMGTTMNNCLAPGEWALQLTERSILEAAGLPQWWHGWGTHCNLWYNGWVYGYGAMGQHGSILINPKMAKWTFPGIPAYVSGISVLNDKWDNETINADQSRSKCNDRFKHSTAVNIDLCGVIHGYIPQSITN